MTNDTRFLNNPNYVRYIELFLQYNKLVAEGKGESAEAEALCDAMDKPWSQLSAAEMERAGIISADLDMLTGNEVFRPVPPEQCTREWLVPHLKNALSSNDWDTYLALLRNGPNYLQSDGLAFMRSIAYMRLGHPEIALMLADYAMQQNPGEIEYALLVQILMTQVGKAEEAAALAKDILAVPSISIFQRGEAAIGLLYAATLLPVAKGHPEFERVASVLSTLIYKSDDVTTSRLMQRFGAILHTALALAYLLLDQVQNALNVYNDILVFDPQNTSAREAKRILTPRSNYRTAKSKASSGTERLKHIALKQLSDSTVNNFTPAFAA